MNVDKAKSILDIRTDDVRRLRAFGESKLRTLTDNAPLRFKAAAKALASI